MSIVGEAKGVIEIVVKGVQWLAGKRDPVRLQAQRLINAFEAHHIARQQIARLLPESLNVSSIGFSSADNLRGSVSPRLLDWASEYLKLSRSWLDGISEQPHVRIDHYKDEERYSSWLRERLLVEPDVNRHIVVWATEIPKLSWSNAPGYLTIAYVETGASLDGAELSRYWLLSYQWPADHVPCVESMLKIVRLARDLDIMVVGRLVNARTLGRLERGRLFAPQVARAEGRLWHPEDIS